MGYKKKTEIDPYNSECKGCHFVSVERGCDVSAVCGRSRTGIYKELGYTGHGGYGCPLRAVTERHYKLRLKEWKIR